MKAIALVSGGLDSTLACSLIKELGIDLVCLNAVSPFCQCNRRKKDGSCQYEAANTARQLGIRLITVDTGREILEIVKNPKYGYGSNMNPCIDCRILLFKKAKEVMGKVSASFVITGEVVGQRPMSQKSKTMALIEKESGLAGLVLRPLSAKALPPTLMEMQGLIDRNKLLSISGRQRREQFTLARAFGIKDFPCPSGGCLLTDKGFSRRLKDQLAYGDLNVDDVRLLKVGRHFRLGDKLKLVVGRNERENKILEDIIKEGDCLLRPQDNIAGASAVLRGSGINARTLELAAAITCRYFDLPQGENAQVKCARSSLQEYVFQVVPLEEEKIRFYRIN